MALSVDHQSQPHSNREMGPAMFYVHVQWTRDTSAIQGIYKQVFGGGSACSGSSVRKHVGREGRGGLLPGRGSALHQPHINHISTYPHICCQVGGLLCINLISAHSHCCYNVNTKKDPFHWLSGHYNMCICLLNIMYSCLYVWALYVCGLLVWGLFCIVFWVCIFWFLHYCYIGVIFSTAAALVVIK